MQVEKKAKEKIRRSDSPETVIRNQETKTDLYGAFGTCGGGQKFWGGCLWGFGEGGSCTIEGGVCGLPARTNTGSTKKKKGLSPDGNNVND